MKIETNNIELIDKDLEGLPLFFKKIQYNKMASLEEEKKLMFYSHQTSSQELRIADPKRRICKISKNEEIHKIR